MASDRKSQGGNRIPIRFDGEEEIEDEGFGAGDEGLDGPSEPQTGKAEADGGPAVAELVASRAELKRLQNALAEAQDVVLRRQADFENYRKRVERERARRFG